MRDDILIINDKKIAFKMDAKKELIYVYNFIGTTIDEDTKSILESINSDLAKEINNYFNIELENIGVVLDDSQPREITKEDEKDIYTDSFTKYTMIFFLVVIALMISDDYSQVNTQEPNLMFLGWIALVPILFMLILVTGKEELKKAQLNVKLKYNIKTRPLPTKEQQLEILEAKIYILLKEKEDAK